MKDPYSGLERAELTCDGVTRTVFRGATGPAVIVIHEIPGLHPGVVAFGRRVIAASRSVVTLDLVDEPGHPTRIALDRVLGFFREQLAVA